MAIAHRTTWTNSTPSTSLGVVTSTTAGDTLVAWAVSDATTTTLTWPTDFVEQATQVTTTDGQVVGVAVKVNASGSEGTLTLGASTNIIGGVSALSGCDTTTQPDATTTKGNNNTTQNSPWSLAASAIVPVTNGAGIVAVLASDVTESDANPTVVFTGGSDAWTTHADLHENFRNIAVGLAVQTTAASLTVTGTGTAATYDAGRAIIVVALRPAGAAGGDAVPQAWAQYRRRAA